MPVNDRPNDGMNADDPSLAPSLDDSRTALAAAQQALLAALVTEADPPAGFDPARIRLQTRALIAKRARTAVLHHPWLADALGPDYSAAFTRYARGHPLPAGGGHADAAAFEAFLRDGGELPAPPRTPSPVRLRRTLAVLRALSARPPTGS
jgi:hypothetical protein